jgi:site-specific DNA recombinase
MPTGAIIYVRVSTVEQAKHGVSLEAQLDLARKYAQFRDLQVLEVISDEGVSGSLPLAERPGGAALLAQVAKDKVGAVIAYKLDRLFRDAADCLEITRQWDQVNVDLHLVDIGGQPVDTSTAMGRFFLTVMAGVAEMERNLIIERTKAAMSQLKANGKRVGGIPYGLQLGPDGASLLPNNDEQRVIKLILRLHKGGKGHGSIAAELQRRGIMSRSGRPFQATQLKRILLQQGRTV